VARRRNAGLCAGTALCAPTITKEVVQAPAPFHGTHACLQGQAQTLHVCQSDTLMALLG